MSHPADQNDKPPIAPEAIQRQVDALCKPPGSLGVIERIAMDLCRIQNTFSPATSPRRVCVFAADHGVTAQGVSAWPSSITASVTEIMGRGRTASGVFAGHLNCDYTVVDVGLLRPVGGDVIDRASRRGTGNLSIEPAMDEATFDAAWQTGEQLAKEAIDDGCRVLIGGEMGIGNTTAAACLTAILTGTDPQRVVGRGAGVDDAGLRRKIAVVGGAVDRVRKTNVWQQSETPRRDPAAVRMAGRQLGGLEIVALAGFYAAATRSRCVVVLDGFIASAAALLADRIRSGANRCMIAAHRGAEPGHAVVLEALGLEAVFEGNLRLGEATGALVVLPWLDLAAAMLRDMATLDELK